MTNFDGELLFLQVTNIKKQVVAGLYYIFTIDVFANPKFGLTSVSDKKTRRTNTTIHSDHII